MHEPVMQGGGYYNEHSELQARSAAEADGMLERALAALVLCGGPVTLADFGSSQGHNSMRQMALILDRLTEASDASRDFMVVHTDLPHCDFTSLFDTLESAPDSYRKSRDHVFACAIGHSFFERLLPRDSLTFGWSAFALHWMSALPNPIAEHVWPLRARPDDAKALADISAADWQRFLAHRAEELVPGGGLVLVVAACEDAGEHGLEPMMDLANEVLRSMVADGQLAARDYAAMTIPVWPRTRAEFSLPFDLGMVPGLVLEELVVAKTPNAAMLRWRQTGDAAAYAADICSFFTAAFGPSLFGRDATAQQHFARRFTEALALSPDATARPLVTATLRIARR